MSEKPDWYVFQEEIATYFRSLGTSANTNQSIQGVRTTHDIDVVVVTKFLGENLTWIIEAKKWTSKVSKDKVLTLRTIVDDIGADKGLIISQKGFQNGAYEAAKNTNVSLYTMEEYKRETKHLVQAEILKMYADRARLLDIRYWSHPKQIRKDYNLRPDFFDPYIDFSGTELLSLIFKAILQGEEANYPIDLLIYSKKKVGADRAENFDELINWLNLNLNMLDRILLGAEYRMMKKNDFNPNTRAGAFFDFDGVKSYITTSEISANPQLILDKYKYGF